MHIIRVSPAYFPHLYHGGSVVADYELDKALVAEGHSVTVLTCKENVTEGNEELLSTRHKVLRYRSFGVKKYGISLGQIVGILRQCTGDTGDKTLVWFGGIWSLSSIFGPIVCRFMSQRYVITPHGVLQPTEINLKSGLIKKIVIKMFINSHLRNAYRVHFTVSSELEQTKVACKGEIYPIIFPLCFDLFRFDRKYEYLDRSVTEKVNISYIGRITPKKRLDLVVAALKILPAEVKNMVRFTVIGPDEQSLWDPNSYTHNAIGVEIVYKGALFGRDLVDAYHDADVLVLCSESENFAISVVEAAYCYCVPLISKYVGVGQYFSKDSAVFAELDACDISKKIEQLVVRPEVRMKLGFAARLVSEQFSSRDLDSNYFEKLLD